MVYDLLNELCTVRNVHQYMFCLISGAKFNLTPKSSSNESFLLHANKYTELKCCDLNAFYNKGQELQKTDMTIYLGKYFSRLIR